MTNDTPLSDAHYGVLGFKQVRGTEHDLIFARKLERELAEAMAIIREANENKFAFVEWRQRAERAEAKLAAQGVVTFTHNSTEEAMSAFTDWWRLHLGGGQFDYMRIECEAAFNAGLEAAAKVCENRSHMVLQPLRPYSADDLAQGSKSTCKHLAVAIRALKGE